MQPLDFCYRRTLRRKGPTHAATLYFGEVSHPKQCSTVEPMCSHETTTFTRVCITRCTGRSQQYTPAQAAKGQLHGGSCLLRVRERGRSITRNRLLGLSLVVWWRLAAGWLSGSQMLDDVLSFANSEGGRVITVTQTRLRLRLRLRLSLRGWTEEERAATLKAATRPLIWRGGHYQRSHYYTDTSGEHGSVVCTGPVQACKSGDTSICRDFVLDRRGATSAKYPPSHTHRWHGALVRYLSGRLCDRTRSVPGRPATSGSPSVPPCLGRIRRGARRRESRGNWPAVRQPPRTAGPVARRRLARARRRGRGTWRHSRGPEARRSSRRPSHATIWYSHSTQPG